MVCEIIGAQNRLIESVVSRLRTFVSFSLNSLTRVAKILVILPEWIEFGIPTFETCHFIQDALVGFVLLRVEFVLQLLDQGLLTAFEIVGIDVFVYILTHLNSCDSWLSFQKLIAEPCGIDLTTQTRAKCLLLVKLWQGVLLEVVN